MSAASLLPPIAEGFLEEARALQSRVVDLRRSIHREPEIGVHNPATRQKVVDDLAELGLDLKLHEQTSGLVAVLRGGQPGKRILLRGDTDALPLPEETGLAFASEVDGAMHACGHDSHTAMLAGAAHLLAARRDQLAGEVIFMFQPGEEGFGGADVMLKEGMPEFDACFALHVAPQIPTGRVGCRPGAIMASFDDFEIEVRGRGGHASMPSDCIDPIPIAAEIVLALQSYVTRQIPPTDPGVLTVSQIHGGTTSNVIPDAVRLNGTMRALSDRTRAMLLEALPRICEGIAATHQAEAIVDIQGGYPVVMNDPGFDAFARETAVELLGERAAILLPSPIMGAEDFAYVLQKAPGAMMLLGVRPPGETDPAPCHSSRMMLDEDAMALGSALHATIATRFLAAG
ncbi:MAG: amidohydrolase [Deltaproteobacteria bacterium]|nr:amidohydrolase [Deltaproteobacteria bacterium]